MASTMEVLAMIVMLQAFTFYHFERLLMFIHMLWEFLRMLRQKCLYPFALYYLKWFMYVIDRYNKGQYGGK